MGPDSQVNVGDLLLESQIALGTRTPTSVQLTHGDMNLDGVIDVRDMLKLQRKVLGLALNDIITTLPGYQTLVAGIDRVEATLQSKTHRFLASLLSEAEATTPNGKLFYVHTDQVGTPQVLTDETGAVAWRASYDPFGMATVTVHTIPEMNVRFPGQYFDQETGLHYNYYRDYDPKSGRYVESDPIGLKGGLNTYQYANANPFSYTDPTGREAVGAVVGLLVGGAWNVLANAGKIGEPGGPTIASAFIGGTFGGVVGGAIDNPAVAAGVSAAITAGLTAYGSGQSLSASIEAAVLSGGINAIAGGIGGKILGQMGADPITQFMGGIAAGVWGANAVNASFPNANASEMCR